MKNYFFALTFCLTLKGFSQDKVTYPDSVKKTYYSVVLNYPTTRIGIIGLERLQKINTTLSFTSSIYAFSSAIFHIGQPDPVYVVFCFQPFHLLIGKTRLKFETGLSATYINSDINNSPNSAYVGYAKDRFWYNLYFGLRYNFKKIPFHTHLAYVPYVEPYNHKRFGGPLLEPVGFEFGIGYILRSTKSRK